MGKGSGFGKTILFGEHFVVYGLPGIPCAMGQKTICEIKILEKGTGPNYELIDNRPVSIDYKEKKKEEYDNLIKAILNYLNVKDKLEIVLSGDLVPASGVGASAACAAALSQAISEEYKLNLTKEEINKSAYVGETAGSGTPSGIDNTCAVYGGFLVFEKNLSGGENKIENLKIKKTIEIVLINSGKAALTKEVVADVKKLKEENEKEFAEILKEYENIFIEAKKAINEYNINKIAQLMDKNQKLLKKINVSSDLLENIILEAKKAGAFSAKLTGTGRGGSVIALTPGKELQNKVAKEMQKKGFEITLTTIG